MKNGVHVDNNGDKHWYENNKLHKKDGPAVVFSNNYKAWYIHGKRHREDGPAIEFSDGDIEWYYNGICVCGGIKE